MKSRGTYHREIPDREADICFCNGKSECGCILETNDGDGEYSDGSYVWLCDTHRKNKKE